MTDEQTTPRGAVLQFEIDRKRWEASGASSGYASETSGSRLRHIAHTAVTDTIKYGGTFVLVVTPEKVTIVQRPDAEEL